jgi:PAS domain S-box-containing protein
MEKPGIEKEIHELKRHHMLEFSPALIALLDRKGYLLEVNHQFKKIFGYSKEELLGKHFKGFMAESSLSKALTVFGKALATGKPQNVEVEIKAKSGEIKSIDITGKVLQADSKILGVQIVGIDITKQRQAERAFKQSERHYQHLFEKMIDGFAYHKIEVDKDNNPVDYTFLEVNKAFEKYTGLRKKDIIGKKVTEVLPGIEKDPAGWIEKYGQVALQGKDLRIEQYSIPLGKWYLVAAYSPQKGYFVTTFQDVTSWIKADIRIKEQSVILNSAIETLDHPFYVIDANNYQVLFSNSAAHGGKPKVNSTCYALTHKAAAPCDGKDHPCPLKVIIKTKKPVVVHHTHYVDHESRFVEVHAYPTLDENNNVSRIIEYTIDITPRKQAELELKESEERLKILFEYAPDAYYLNDLKGNLVDGNKAAEKLTGYKREELIGQSFLKLGLLPKSHIPKAAKLLAKNALGRPTGPDEFLLAHKNGSLIPTEISTYPVKIKNKTYVLGIARNISQAKQAAEALKSQKRFLESLIDTIPNPIFYKNLAGKYTGCNNAFEEIMGRPRKEIIGKTTFDLAPKDMADMCHEKDNELFRNPGRQMYTWQIKGSSGEIREVIFNKATYLDSKGKVDGLIGVISDITKLKRAEEKLEKHAHHLEELIDVRTKELQNAHKKLIRKERLTVLGQLAGSVGHDLRTPLGAIKNSTYFLKMALQDPDPEIKEMLGIIDKEISTSEGIISELLDYARSKAPKKKMVDINEAVEDALSRVQVPAEIRVEKHLENGLPAIMADLIQLGQIFTNIIQNAVQAMPEGGQMTLETTLVDKSHVLISISDTGIGIPEENLGKLFDPLFTTKAKGIGLGLAMVKNLVEQHGGTIQAESREGEGSTFTISFKETQYA